jgi:hypothetical protein
MSKDHETEPWRDPIVEEIHVIREAHAAEFDYDLDRMYAALIREADERKRQHGTVVGGAPATPQQAVIQG